MIKNYMVVLFIIFLVIFSIFFGIANIKISERLLGIERENNILLEKEIKIKSYIRRLSIQQEQEKKYSVTAESVINNLQGILYSPNIGE